MSLESPITWWVLAGVLVAAELASGTFYLLMLALGCMAGALAAHLGLSPSLQMTTAALVGIGATMLWHLKRSREPRAGAVESNRDVNLDVGEQVHVAAWAANGEAQVNYRGSTWQASFRGDGKPHPGEHVIAAVHSNRLVLERKLT
jgi:membrane protein implicated in regulation of membrane protease activity